jgi:hypothetical protein
MEHPSALWDDDEERRVRFLLGTLTSEAQAELEDRMLVDPAFHEELLAAADDLIRAYLAGKLPPDDHWRFERHFLASPRRRERYEFIRALMSTVEEELAEPGLARRVPARERQFAPVFWAAAACVLVVLGAWWLRPRPDWPRIAGPSETATPPATPRPALTQTRAPRAARTESPRSGIGYAGRSPTMRLPDAPTEPVEVTLARETEQVRLEMPVEDGRHSTYDAEIRRAEGGEAVWQARALMPRAPGEPLVLEVPAHVLVADAYELRVTGERLRDAPTGSELSRSYHLRITRRR